MAAIFRGDGTAAGALMAAHVSLLGDTLSDVLHILEHRAATTGWPAPGGKERLAGAQPRCRAS